jgi:peptidoglycan/xylan/chitin deacetylase (PgdA/CDA1 family)
MPDGGTLLTMNAVGRSALAILAFHKIGEPPPSPQANPWYIPEATFRSHLRFLASNGWVVLSIDTFLRALSAPGALPQRSALLTFDDGYKSLLNSASQCLLEFGYPAVAFVPTHFVGGYNDFDEGVQPKEAICSWDDLRELERRSFSIQSHGVRHRSFARIAPEEQEEELRCSKIIIEAELGKPVEAFAYPYGNVGDRAVGEVLKRAGYRSAFLFGGGVAALPVESSYFLPRVDMYPDTDLAICLGSS